MLNTKKFIKFILIFILFVFTFNIITPEVFAAISDAPAVYSPSAILIDFSSGKILYEKNMSQKMYPASITKIMTAILALENSSLDDIVTITDTAVNSVEYGYVTANLKPGEQLTVEQLLYTSLVGSANDSALALAEHVSGSVEGFCELMNKKAEELGCKNTNFTNPNGTHNDNHFSTAYDLSLIARYCYANETFKTMINAKTYKLSPTNLYNSDRYFSTTNELLLSGSIYYYKYANGIKTGFTTPAGNCIAASAQKGDFTVIAIVLGGQQTANGLNPRYLDCSAMFEYAFDNYSFNLMGKNGNIVQTINVKNATKDTKKLDLVLENDVYTLIDKNSTTSTILPEIKILDNLKAPIEKGDIVGTATYTSNDVHYTVNLLANSIVNKSYALIIISIIVFILLAWECFLRIRRFKRKKKRLELKKRGF